MNDNAQAGGATDLLSSILGVTVRNEEKISEADRLFCESRQEKLYNTLNQLKWWYELFTTNAERYRESHNLSYSENGSVIKRNPHRNYLDGRQDYSDFEFLPFDCIDDVVKLYGRAVEAFVCDIIRYFNRTYLISVPEPYIDDEKLPMGFMPVYQTYVDSVIGHLGGKGFRDVAQEELLKRFHKIVVSGYHKKMLDAQLKGDKIIISNALWYENYPWQTNLCLSFRYTDVLNDLCAGVIFGLTGSLDGGISFIADYRRDEVDVTRWYDINIGEKLSVKFFKNHRVDFKFENAGAAEMCWRKLRLDRFITTPDNE